MAYPLRTLLHGILLVLGVTFISFLLMVWFGPDQSYTLLGKNATVEQIAEVRHELGYDQPFLKRYADFLVQLATLDLGSSNSSGERVGSMLARSVPVTLALMLPGFLLGNLLGIALGLKAAQRRGRWSDRLISGLSITGMSLSFLIIIIALQVLLSTPHGLNLFPVRGWQVTDLPSYLRYVTVPTIALLVVTLGYNTRFYRAVFVDEFGKDHIRTAQAFGASPMTIMWKHVLKNGLVPIITRILFSIPLVVISGSLLIESYFGIPGVGKVTFEAITNGDQPVLKAVVALTAVAFVVIQVTADLLYRLVDPRVA
ncbi:MAG: ABC transporter permease [Xanthomonadales bacterium]|jgi:peptide/nickel transport system permease protein|nr:ABC transporter permease [Xanthomonadales bacterium]